jgi:hypothetical protein
MSTDANVLKSADALWTQCPEDLRVARRVELALRTAGYGARGGNAVAFRSRLAMITGRVPNCYLKQVVQEVVQSVPGAHQVRNCLHVLQAR